MNRYEALKHAVKAHGSELDKCGQLAVLHPIAVAEAVERTNPPEVADRIEVDVAAALLHDVIEDTDYPLGDFLSGRLATVLGLLTHCPLESYASYIDRLCADEIAATVKLADLYHNLQPERQACLPPKEQASLEKRYLKARDQIWDALGYRWWPEEVERG